jgi:hypothetical protein
VLWTNEADLPDYSFEAREDIHQHPRTMLHTALPGQVGLDHDIHVYLQGLIEGPQSVT